MATWTPTRVTLDLGTDEEPVFDAFTDGSTWNGWIIPYFTEEEGQRVAAWLQLFSSGSVEPDTIEIVEWDPATRDFTVVSGDLPDETERVPVESRFVGELNAQLYAIGGSRWTWEAA